MDDVQEKLRMGIDLLSSIDSTRPHSETSTSGQQPPQGAAVQLGNRPSQDAVFCGNRPSLGGYFSVYIMKKIIVLTRRECRGGEGWNYITVEPV